VDLKIAIGWENALCDGLARKNSPRLSFPRWSQVIFLRVFQ